MKSSSTTGSALQRATTIAVMVAILSSGVLSEVPPGKNERCHWINLDVPECRASMFPLTGYGLIGWFYHAAFKSCRPAYAEGGIIHCIENFDLPLTKVECEDLCATYCPISDGTPGICMLEEYCTHFKDPNLVMQMGMHCNAYNVKCCPPYKPSDSLNQLKVRQSTLPPRTHPYPNDPEYLWSVQHRHEVFKKRIPEFTPKWDYLDFTSPTTTYTFPSTTPREYTSKRYSISTAKQSITSEMAFDLTTETPTIVTAGPTVNVTAQPAVNVTAEPAVNVTIMPAVNGTEEPAAIVTTMPAVNVTAEPAVNGTAEPVTIVTTMPAVNVTAEPAVNVTTMPAVNGTAAPAAIVTTEPAATVTTDPAAVVTVIPAVNDTAMPAVNGTAMPTVNGTAMPTVNGTAMPTVNGTSDPAANGTAMPTLRRRTA